VTDQYVWGAGDGPDPNGWESQAASCVANAICTMKEIHEYRQIGTSNQYSIGWVYGNRLETDWQGEGMIVSEALDRLITDGVPIFTELPEIENNGWQSWTYPDTYFYDDWVDGSESIIGAKTLVDNNYSNVVNNARIAKISSYQEISVETANLDAIKQSIIDNGSVLIETYIANNFDWLGGSGCDGIVPPVDYNIEVDEVKSKHCMVIVGWKIISGTTYWIVHNNWGNWWWGDENRRGYCYMPLDYENILYYYLVIDYLQPVTILPYDDNTCKVVITDDSSTNYYNLDVYDGILSSNNGWHEANSSPQDWSTTKTRYIDYSSENTYDHQPYSVLPTIEVRLRIATQSDGSDWDGITWYYSNEIPNLKYSIRPSNFSWTTTPNGSNQPVNITAYDWNSLCENINDVRVYKGYSQITFTLVVSDVTPISATIFNTSRSAINDIGTYRSLVNQGDDMYSSHFTNLAIDINNVT
jgi:hypothetical protein